ncbi:MAG: DUF4129 domain-containing protein [Chloroflexi bacterium]|nr:DUF4129 domain-containing protein [Chloroflexota bacterium]
MPKLDWHQETLYVLLAGMEAIWLSALLGLVSRPDPGLRLVRSPWALLAVTLSALWLSRLVNRLRLDLTRSRLLILYLAGLTVLLMLKAGVYSGYPWWNLDWLGQAFADAARPFAWPEAYALVVAAGLYLWWRGLRLGRERPSPGTVYFRFQVGLAALVVACLSPVFYRSLARPAVGLIFGFFSVSLLAVAAARLQAIARGPKPFQGRHWLGILVAFTLLVLFSSALLASLGLEEAASWLWTGLGLAGHYLGRVLFLLLVPLGLLAELLVYILRHLRSRFMAGDLPTPPPQLQERTQETLPPLAENTLLVHALSWLLFALLAALVLALLARSFRQSRRRPVEETEEIRESLGGMSLLFADLATWWDRLLGRLRVKRRQVAAPRAPYPEPGTAEYRLALSIRQIYVKLLALGAAREHPRQPPQTPYEYAQMISGALPDSSAEIGLITEVYVRVRYGASPVNDSQEAAVRQAWERVRHQAFFR